MSENPYLEDDSDIFEEEGEESKEKPRYVMRGPNGEELPPELQERLSNYIDSYWDGAGGRTASSIPDEFLALGQLFGFFARFTTFREEGSLLLAVAEVLDEQTDGRVKQFFKLHEAEREIVYTHLVLEMVNLIHQGVSQYINDPSEHYIAEVLVYLETLGDMYTFTQNTAIKQYKTLATTLGVEIDTGLVEEGVISKRSAFANVSMAHYEAKEDVD